MISAPRSVPKVRSVLVSFTLQEMCIRDSFCIVSFREIKETMNFYLKMMLREIETRAPGYEAVCQEDVYKRQSDTVHDAPYDSPSS